MARKLVFHKIGNRTPRRFHLFSTVHTRQSKIVIRSWQMIKLIAVVLVFSALVTTITSCSLLPQVSREELEQVVQRDSVSFDIQAIPDEILDDLASHRVVLVGETHFIDEHREWMDVMLRELHARGFRQILIEWTQVADWLMTDFVNEGGLEPDWVPPMDLFGGVIARKIREFNRTLPDDEHFQIHPIDVTLPDHGGSESFLWSLGQLSQHFPDPGPIGTFLQGDYDSEKTQKDQLASLQTEMNANRSELMASWGEHWFNTVEEMVKVEMASVTIRAIRESNYDKSVRLREAEIKRLADLRIQDYPYGTVINMGSTHAQKKRLRGTEIEWLGDYLVHKSKAVDGSIIVLDVSAAYITSVPGSGIPDYDLSASPENELFRIMNESGTMQMVYLPMNDPIFINGRIPMNYESTIYTGFPQRYYDVYVVFRTAQRTPRVP